MNEQPFGFIKLYTPTGVLVSLPIPVDGSIIGTQEAQAVMQSVTNYLSAGFLVTEPGMNEGEQREAIGWVCRRSKVNDDDTETPIIDLYADHEKMTWKVLSVYLNTPADVTAFEAASGLKLDKLPLLVSPSAPERGANKQTDKFVVRVSRPFNVVHEQNPAYDPDKKKPKRRFVRWDAGVPDLKLAEKPAPQTVTDRNQPPADGEDELQWVDDMRNMDANGQTFTTDFLVTNTDSKKRPYYTFTDGGNQVAYTYSRLELKDYLPESALDILNKPGRHDFGEAFQIVYITKAGSDGKQRNEVVRIEKLAQLQPASGQ